MMRYDIVQAGPGLLSETDWHIVRYYDGIPPIVVGTVHGFALATLAAEAFTADAQPAGPADA